MSTKVTSLIKRIPALLVCLGLTGSLVAAPKLAQNSTTADSAEPIVRFPGATEKQADSSIKSPFNGGEQKTPPPAIGKVPTPPPAPPVPAAPGLDQAQNLTSVKISIPETLTASSKDNFLDYVVTFRNEGAKPVEITHIGTAPFNMIKLANPIKLAPKQTATQSMSANIGKLRQGATLPVFAIEKGSSGNNTIVGQTRLNFTDIPNIETQVVMWRVGDALTEKAVALKLPAGTKAEKVIVSPGFTARLDGTNVLIKPTATDSQAAAVIRVMCSPDVRSDLAPMITAVIQK